MKKQIVGIVGLGYVGLALVKSLCEHGFEVIGIDNDKKKIEQISECQSPNESISDQDLLIFFNLQKLQVSTDPDALKQANVVVIAVPTPLTESGEPDLSILEFATGQIAPHLKSDALLINESTSYPGTLRNLIAPIVKKIRTDDAKFLKFACSPERVNPGDSVFHYKNTPRVVSGLDDHAKKLAQDFYSNFVEQVNVVSSPEVAEMSKILENSYRLVNISFINEISDYCVSQGIPVREVISAASTKPFGFMPFFPGPGVGGHCIPVDPVYLLADAAKKGHALDLLDSALSLNRSRFNYIINYLEKENGSIEGKKILLVGVTYKPNVTDTRETPAKALFEALENKGALVSWNDSLVQFWNNSQSSSLAQQNWDITLVLVLHDSSNLAEIVQNSKLIYDFTGKIPQVSEKVLAI